VLESDVPDFTGFSHVALTVTELDRTKQWYADVLGWEPLMEGEDNGIRFAFGILAGGQVGVGLRQHSDGDGSAFSANRTGLDHISFAVGSRPISRPGRNASATRESTSARSSMRRTARSSASRTPTASRWRPSRRWEASRVEPRRRARAEARARV